MRATLMRVVRAVRCGLALFPLTLLGVLVAGVAIAFLKWLAYGQLDLTLFVVGYAALGLTVVAALWVTLAAAWLRWRARPGRTGALLAETGQAAATGFHLPSFRFVPFVQLRWSWLRPSQVEVSAREEHGALHEWLRPQERGQYRVVVRTMAVQDPFGLARVVWRREEPVELDVLPHVGALRRMPVLTALSQGDDLPHPLGVADGDRMELRRYTAGDPARFIHWRAYARTRKLTVRYPERAVTPARRTAAFLVAGAQDDASAAAARVALEAGLLGDEWLFGSDADPQGTNRLREALATVMRSSTATERGAAQLPAFLERARKSGPVSALLFVPPVPGPWLDRVIAAVQRHQGPIRAIIGVDGIREQAPRSRWQHWVARVPFHASHEAGQLREVVRRLSAARCQSLVLDRVSGRALSQGHFQPRASVGRSDREKAA